MNFHRTTEYAFRIMSFMAKDQAKLYHADEIYIALKIPRRYLRRQMTLLNKKGLLTSIQGKYGGYKLSRKVEEITLFDIVEAMDDPVFEHECFFGYENCALDEQCAMHNKWAGIKNNIENILKHTSLKELKDENTHKFITDNSLITN